ncbi:MAG: hypothetical protein E4H43_00340 [Bacteroidia bacterium]|nr:MAG: hypothetical protein E4H43_00340 [Bacteroidia bacterium]
MKLKIFIVNVILLVIGSRIGFCQTDTGQTANTINSESLLSGELFDQSLTPDFATYFNIAWLEGDILLTNGRIARNKKIKYNGLLDELFWLEPVSNQTIKLDKESILQFHFLDFQGDTTIRFRKIKVKQDIFTDSSEIFVQEINKGKLSLLISYSFYFAGKETVRTNKGSFLKDIYKEEPVYYLSFPDNRLIELRRFSRKNLYTSLSDKKDLIRQYYRESSSGKIRTGQEILDFVQFLSSISD